MEYLTVDEVKRGRLGVKLASFDGPDIEEAIEMAKEEIDSYTGSGGFEAKLWPNEDHHWSGEDLSFIAYHGPIRKMVSAGIVVGANPHSAVTWPLDVDEMVIEEYMDSGQSVNIFLQVGAIPIISFIEPRFRISYWAGYDDTDPDDPTDLGPDGVKMPLPRWLKKATLLMTRHILEEALLSAKGMGILTSYRVGPVSYSRPSKPQNKEGVEIPQRVRNILDNNYQRVWVSDF